MIFKSIETLSTKAEKNFFLEQIDIYIRLIEVFCERENIKIESDKTPNYEELISIGVICEKSEITNLRKILNNKFDHFMECVNFASSNIELMDGLLDKLYNSKRKELQSKRLKDEVRPCMTGTK